MTSCFISIKKSLGGSGAFPEKKVLSPNIANVIQDHPSSNVQKQPWKDVVKKSAVL